MLKKLFFLLLLLGLLNVPFACSDGSSCNFGTHFNNISGLESDFGVFLESFSGYYQRDSTSSDSAIFRISVSEIEFIEFASGPGSFLPVAMAESCPYISALHHTLDSIEITSSNDIHFNGLLYEAGENLADFFQLTEAYNTDQQFTVGEYPAQLQAESKWFSGEDARLYFQFATTPDSRASGTFTFSFIFDDRILTTVSSEVVIF